MPVQWTVGPAKIKTVARFATLIAPCAQPNSWPAMPMLRSRLFMLILATLLIAQSALGMALHRCHDDVSDTTHHIAASGMDSVVSHCHGAAAARDDATTGNMHTGADRSAAPHGICTCGIAHCAPALISQFEFASTPTHSSKTPPYCFAVIPAPAETLLRPPIFLS